MTSKPPASSEAARRRMEAQRTKDTQAELLLRRELWRRGLRYRLHVGILPGDRRRVDIVFPQARVAVNVHGCFWHGCPRHATSPKANASWWDQKLRANKVRDDDLARRLHEAGWVYIVVWECEAVAQAADRVEGAARKRNPAGASHECPPSSG